MVTGAATATNNRIPVLLLPGDIFVDIAKDGTTLQGLMNSLMIAVSVVLISGVAGVLVGTTSGFWVSQADFYLETAIRTDPKAPSAERAYALLEESIIEGYSGSAGVNVPPEESARLAELRALMASE